MDGALCPQQYLRALSRRAANMCITQNAVHARLPAGAMWALADKRLSQNWLTRRGTRSVPPPAAAAAKNEAASRCEFQTFLLTSTLFLDMQMTC